MSAIAAAVAVTFALAACATGDGADSSDTRVQVTAPPTIVPPRTEASPADSAPDSDDAPGAASVDGSAPQDGSSSTLTPSDEADLPTGPPPSAGETATTTTIPGPLTEPTVTLASIGDFDRPVAIATRPQDERIFVVEQRGRIIAIDDLATEVLLDISGAVSGGGEQGLLGLAFHPERELAYVDYTDRDGNTVVAEYAIDPVTAVFDPESQRTLLTIDQPFGNHNGGGLVFGPDRRLYIGTGDGGSGGDPQRNGLDLATRLGKLLRIDPLPSADAPFTVPDDNPFLDVPGADPTIWSYGLRNPWKFSFDPATGDLWIADVGQNAFEEIDLAPATNGRGAGRGLGFGWSALEANARFNADQSPDGQIPPVVAYGHDGGNCSVSGGAVARDSSVPNLDGWYVYGDFCSGTIWGYDPASVADAAPRVIVLGNLPQLSAIGSGPDGELYALSTGGTVARFAPG